MRRDAIFYKLFQQSPSLLFELLESVPGSAAKYRFESVTVKEPTFSIDGVFLPPEDEASGIVFFAEVQMQKVNRLYERLFAESMAYFYRNRDSFSDWQAVLIYSSRCMEQDEFYPYRALLGSGQVHRIYLDELGNIEDLPLGVAAMVLTIVEDVEAGEKARMLIKRAEASTSALRKDIVEMINTIIAYKFTNLSRKEIDEMLGTKFEETRVYRETREEERQVIALNLLRQGLAIESIAQATGLTIEQIQKLQVEMG